jgi:hypothetical protein
MKKLLFLILLFVSYLVNGQQCGKWRWAIKTLTDPGAAQLLNQQPQETTIGQILTDVPPQPLRTQSMIDGVLPRFPTEKQLVVFTANIKEVKHEGDQDYHLILEEPTTGKEMVGEIPDPNCPSFNGFPDLQTRFATLRKWVDKNVGNSNEDGDPAITVKIVGVKFWDEPGHATGSPPNGREIHPVTDIITADGSVITVSNSPLISPSPTNTSPATQPTSSVNMPTTSTAQQMLYLIMLGAILGMAGQVIRFIAGIRKSAPAGTTNIADVLVTKQMLIGLFISLIIGSIAGVLASINMAGKPIDNSVVIAFLAAGYAGTDLIEGFIIKK